ncbi:hypothetical protein Desku_0834 [Desulfofundulus kuznetsovii DSM 6115]|uniref:Uncharacterized protein n=1 Tax=Desulfofundulus kuznetsovii (strain DSM 6115 / VKM B-1805 / 17) TaxID=760568 RepID=A0AAU8PFL2_DESK7|nr:hypothetical protein Desku_0834 [Desulfofundulus kuznetsovii DSM 6115]
MAELFLRLLVKHHPKGVSTAFAAKKLYGSASDRNKRKVYRLAKALRDMNYVVYGNEGIYKLASDDPNFLFAVNQKRGKNTVGTVYSQVRLLIENYRANPDPALLAELDSLREWLTKELVNVVSHLKGEI